MHRWSGLQLTVGRGTETRSYNGATGLPLN